MVADMAGAGRGARGGAIEEGREVDRSGGVGVGRPQRRL